MPRNYIDSRALYITCRMRKSLLLDDDAAAVLPPSAEALLDLPEELLQLVLVSTADAPSALRFASTCRLTSRFVARSEALWQDLCESSWPFLTTMRRFPTAHLRTLPPQSWRSLFKSRTREPGWRLLLPLYDESAHVARHRLSGWVARLGTLLLRIQRVRAVHQLVALAVPDSPAGGLDTASEGGCWACSLLHDVLLGAVDVMAYAGDPPALEVVARRTHVGVEEVQKQSLGAKLQEWDTLIEQGRPHWEDSTMALLVDFFAGRSALEAIHDVCVAGEVAPPPYNMQVRALARKISEATSALDADLDGLRQEGCDLSLTAAARHTTECAPPSSHWWWKIEAPLFVSGGCPMIPRR
jgi:hypothetical protein